MTFCLPACPWLPAGCPGQAAAAVCPLPYKGGQAGSTQHLNLTLLARDGHALVKSKVTAALDRCHRVERAVPEHDGLAVVAFGVPSARRPRGGGRAGVATPTASQGGKAGSAKHLHAAAPTPWPAVPLAERCCSERVSVETDASPSGLSLASGGPWVGPARQAPAVRSAGGAS